MYNKQSCTIRYTFVAPDSERLLSCKCRATETDKIFSTPVNWDMISVQATSFNSSTLLPTSSFRQPRDGRSRCGATESREKRNQRIGRWHRLIDALINTVSHLQEVPNDLPTFELFSFSFPSQFLVMFILRCSWIHCSFWFKTHPHFAWLYINAILFLLPPNFHYFLYLSLFSLTLVVLSFITFPCFPFCHSFLLISRFLMLSFLFSSLFYSHFFFFVLYISCFPICYAFFLLLFHVFIFQCAYLLLLGIFFLFSYSFLPFNITFFFHLLLFILLMRMLMCYYLFLRACVFLFIVFHLPSFLLFCSFKYFSLYSFIFII